MKPIGPTIWEKLGKNDEDQARQEEQDFLRDKAREFATGRGTLDLVKDECAWAPDHPGDAVEYDDLQSAALLPFPCPTGQCQRVSRPRLRGQRQQGDLHLR